MAAPLRTPGVRWGIGVLLGAVMKATRGQADAGRARELILRRLS